ncbi:hypothetical protein [Streptomyces sp. NBC_00316]|uniref:hypothetical protein n=1 Tax=Streptomyces sp. NBC_00316 TaxID=2975710 RepID=UPI002E291146|nr:hypothetical protein [Streptomyces sp. NBC_00316]
MVAAVSMTAALALAVTACGSDDGGQAKDTSSPSSAPSKPSEEDKGAQQDTAAGDKVDPNAKLAVLKGAESIEYTVTSVVRDSGGFVTVTGQMKNTGTDTFSRVSRWRGNEKEILLGSGDAVSGGTLVDQQGKKRYYVLRDTDGRCLCTTGISKIEAGESVPVFMQFPAPPEGTDQVDLSIPTFDSVAIKISG